jgi:hypothetical protein
MSRATFRPPIPKASAATNATAPSTIKKVGAVSSTGIPSCVTAAKIAYMMIAYQAMLARMSKATIVRRRLGLSSRTSPPGPPNTASLRQLPECAAPFDERRLLKLLRYDSRWFCRTVS